MKTRSKKRNLTPLILETKPLQVESLCQRLVILKTKKKRGIWIHRQMRVSRAKILFKIPNHLHTLKLVRRLYWNEIVIFSFNFLFFFKKTFLVTIWISVTAVIRTVWTFKHFQYKFHDFYIIFVNWINKFEDLVFIFFKLNN